MTLCVGEVISVEGTKISLRIFDESSLDTIYWNGKRYNGVSIREYISIRRGFRDIVCIVQGEYLDERRTTEDFAKVSYIRRVELKPVGYFDGDDFCEGIKYLPMIKDSAYLIADDDVRKIYGNSSQEQTFIVGKMMGTGIPVSLPWQKLFNTHIGIFGNTGSGKSNTLTQLYTVLFSAKSKNMKGKSHFLFIDFNGEYTKNQLLPGDSKKVIELQTKGNTKDRFRLTYKEFWDAETLSVLFQATPNTQRPFLVRLIKGRERYQNANSLQNYFRKTFEAAFSSAAQKPESLDLLKGVAKLLQANELIQRLNSIVFNGHPNQKKFVMTEPQGTVYFDSPEKYNQSLRHTVEAVELAVNAFDELILRIHLRLAMDLIKNFVQFEHIQPLLSRANASMAYLRQVIEVSDEKENDALLTVISLKGCETPIKKLLALMIAKHSYDRHRLKVKESPPEATFHLIVDEAHNVLSEQSTREHETWRDYRLELFEEIIKEGRKVGMFLTLASQRPADISATIISQLHNFFIHRLVNDRDLFLMENSINTLDHLSRSQIPNLAKGCCIVTGTSFDLPMTVQFEQLPKEKKPDSDDVSLANLWA